MEQLYSIGQVSKLKGVSPRMLRYYDKLGILVPSSVDEETGYRRYTLDQMMELDVIRMCVAANIPLSELSAIQQLEPETATLRLLKEAQRRLVAHIETLERTKSSIEDYLAELEDERTMPQESTTGFLSSGVVIARPWEESCFDAKLYLRSMTELEEGCRKLGLAPFLKRGIAFDVAKKQAWSFIEVASANSLLEEPVSALNKHRIDSLNLAIMTLPEGCFEGIKIRSEGITETFKKGFACALAIANEPALNTGNSITLTERWGASLGKNLSTVLLRIHERALELLPL